MTEPDRPTRETSREEAQLLAAAQRGEEAAFVGLTSPHRQALHLHCYRLLGSLHDADDALQETLLNAWRAIPNFEPRAPLRAWLHRIATNVALRMIEGRRDPAAPVDAHLQPYPDNLFNDVPARQAGPDEEVIVSEGVGLAIVAAIQLLPPKQRAVLVLREALGWRATEVADLLEDSVAAVNSALQRARATIAREQEAGTLARVNAPASRGEEALVIRRFQEAWARVDVEGIVALLTDDALLSMPPVGMRFEGSESIGRFFATEPLGGRLDRIELVEVRANGQPALASYADEDRDGVRRAYGVMVIALNGSRISGITGFPRDAALFSRFGLPTVLSSGPS
jgi:RNA polymerase sigma-70 factor (ECF subfamily)